MNKEKVNKRGMMFDMIRKWKESSMSQAAFCREHKIALSTFTYWLHKFRKQENKSSLQREKRSSGKFLELNVNKGAGSDHGFRILYPTGVQLYFSASVDTDQLQRLVHLF